LIGRVVRASSIAVGLACHSAALPAQEAPPSEAATLSVPAPALSPICTDRPTKTNYACTVDAGHFQYESDVINGSSLELGGTTTSTLLIINPTLKYGVSSDMDVELNLSPFERVRVREQNGAVESHRGLSDLYLRLKYLFVDSANGVLQASIIPYLKAPTARVGVGNGAFEGGALVPINYKLNSVLTLTTVPELDAYKDSIGAGHHLNTAQVLNLAIALPRAFTFYGELWSDWNWDPAGTIRQRSTDFALTYGATAYLQLDAGVNLGLNRATPQTQLYLGLSQKF
jgi:Putative MetA-pathway of phenol degradation